MKTYKIVDGLNGKKNIEYYEDGELLTVELYSQEGFTAEIKPGFVNADAPNWNGLKQSLWNNAALLGKAYASCATKPANAVGIALLSDTMKDGHDGIGTPNGFLRAWGMIDVAWTDEEKATVNGYLEENNFTIRIS